jgi:shikimate dehydrogenase
VAVPLEWPAGARLLLDVVYDGWPTPLARSARAAGLAVVGGLEMLVAQAAKQFELFTGLAAPVDAMRLAGLRELR